MCLCLGAKYTSIPLMQVKSLPMFPGLQYILTKVLDMLHQIAEFSWPGNMQPGPVEK